MPVGHTRLAALAYLAGNAGALPYTDRLIDGAAALQPAQCNRIIGLPQTAVGARIGKDVGGMGVFGGEQQPAGIAVKAVERPEGGRCAGFLVVRHHRVGHRRLGAPGGRVHRDVRRFVEQQHRLILVQHLERQLDRLNLHHIFRQLQDNFLSGFHPINGADRQPVGGHAAVNLLDAGKHTGGIAVAAPQKALQRLSVVFRRHRINQLAHASASRSFGLLYHRSARPARKIFYLTVS